MPSRARFFPLALVLVLPACASSRFGTPTWIAARPMPGAAYIVSNMSSISVCRPASIASTGVDTVRSRGSGVSMIGRMAIHLKLGAEPARVNP